MLRTSLARLLGAAGLPFHGVGPSARARSAALRRAAHCTAEALEARINFGVGTEHASTGGGSGMPATICPIPPVSSIDAGNSTGLPAGQAQMSTAPVRYQTGTPSVTSVDLQSDAFGKTWAQARVWTGWNEASQNGNGWAVTGLPYLTLNQNEYLHAGIVRVNDGGATYDFVGDGTVPSTTFSPLYPQKARLDYVAPATVGGTRLPGEFRLTDSAGNVTSFYDLPRDTYPGGAGSYARLFGGAGLVQESTDQWSDVATGAVYGGTSGVPGTAAKYRFGAFKGYADAGGRLAVTTDHDADGNVTAVVRTDGSGQYERFKYEYAKYAYDAVNKLWSPSVSGTVPLVSKVSLQRAVNPTSEASWDLKTVRSAEYDYYSGYVGTVPAPDATGKYGRFGDLKTVVVKDYQKDQANPEVVDRKYYRYTKMYGTSSNSYHGAYDRRGPTNELATTGGTDTDFAKQTGDNFVQSGLRAVFEGAAYARLAANRGDVAAFQDDDDADVNPYAIYVFRYARESDNPPPEFGVIPQTRFRVVQEAAAAEGCSSCSGGFGTYNYEYYNNGQYNPFVQNYDLLNRWTTRFTEYLPDTTNADANGDGRVDDDQWADNDRRVVYVNQRGAPLVEALIDKHGTAAVGDDARTVTYHRYDAEGRLEFVAHPDAVADYEDGAGSPDDLVGWIDNTEKMLLSGQGLVEHYEYGTSTTAGADLAHAGDVTGLLWRKSVRRGFNGADVPIESYKYVAHSVGTPATVVYPLAVSSAYWDVDGNGSPDAVDTTYDYTWWKDAATGTIDTNRVRSQTVTLAAVTLQQNGPGSSTSTVTYFDAVGRPTWAKDADGFITYTAYDNATGAVNKRIADVDMSQTGTFANSPGWSTPSGGGLHLTTAYDVDKLGRAVKQTEPNGNLDYWVYNDATREVRQYHSGPGTFAQVGPVTVSRTYWPAQSAAVGQRAVYDESLTTSATPLLTAGVPNGTETVDQTNIQSLARTATNDAGQQVDAYAFHSLAGVTYGTATVTLGAAGTNYYDTRTDYDSRGRVKRVESPLGTVTRYLYDARGLPTQTWVGTDDAPTSGFWSPANTAGTDLVKVAEYGYDVAGDQTTATAYPGGSAAPRVTQTFYDWRHRAVLVKAGAQASEADGTHRPLTRYEYDNQDRVTMVEQYDGDGQLAATPVSTAPSVPNGGFELPDVPSGVYSQPTMTSWRFGTVGGIAANTGSGAPPSPAPEGDQAGVAQGLQGVYAFRQVVSGWADGTYTISFKASQGNAAQPLTFDLVVDGRAVGTFTPSGTTYASYATGSFVETAGSHMVAVVPTSNNGAYGYLDDVKVNLVSAAGVAVADADNDGVPDQPSSALRRARSVTKYDAWGRADETQTFPVDPSTGAVLTDGLKSDTWYDKRGNTIKVLQPGGLVTKTAYDGAGRTTKTYATDGGGDAAAGTTGSWTDAGNVNNDNVLEQAAYAYDANGNVTLTTNKQRFHDAVGTGELGTATTGVLARVSYSASYYDAADRPVANATAGTNGGAAYSRPTQAPVTGMATSGSTTTLVDGGRTEATNAFNGFTIQVVAGTGAGQTRTVSGYNGTTKTFTVSAAFATAPDATSRYLVYSGSDLTAIYGYDAAGRVRDTTDAAGHLTRTAYDLLGRQTSVTENYADGTPSAADDRVTRYTYDGLGHVLTMTADLPVGTNDQVTQYLYGEPDQTVSSLTRSGSTATATVAAGHGLKVGETVTVTGAAQAAYNGSFVVTAASATTVSYAVVGTPTTPDAGTAIKVRRAGDVYANGLLREVRYPNTSTGAANPADAETYSYNALGQPKTMADRNGNVHAYAYDVLGRTTADAVTTLGTGVDGTVRRVEVAYNSQGLPSLFTQYNVATAPADANVLNQVRRDYTGLGQLAVEYQAVGTGTAGAGNKVDAAGGGTPRVQYAYAGPSATANYSRLSSMTYPNGRVLRYEYNAGVDSGISRLSFLAEDAGGSVGTHLEELSYLGLGTVVARNHPQPGLNLTYVGTGTADAGDKYVGLDRFGRVVDQRWVDVAGGTVPDRDADRFGYTYDRNSNVLTKDWSSYANQSGFDEAYAYDGFDRLTKVNRGNLAAGTITDANATYTQRWDGTGGSNGLDALGNWTGVTTDTNGGAAGGSTTQTRTHNGQNQTTAVSGATSPTYDAAGDMLTDESGTGLVYDAWGRTVKVKTSGGVDKVTYTVDPLGRRAAQSVGSAGVGASTRYYFSNQWQVLQEDEFNGSAYAAKFQTVFSPVYVDAVVERDSISPVAAGALDTGFSGDGKFTYDFAVGGADAFYFVQQADGKLVGVGQAGNTSTAMVRLNADGTLDNTFDGPSGTGNGAFAFKDGTVTKGFGLAVQSDGKIVVVGQGASSTAFVGRFNPDGSWDTAFDGPGATPGDGHFTLPASGLGDRAYGVVVQPDGKVVVVGFTGADMWVVRLNGTDGLYDTSFDTDGKQTVDFGGSEQAYRVALDRDGKVVVAGTTSTGSGGDMAVARLNANGSLDTSFDTDGKQTVSFTAGVDSTQGGLAIDDRNRVLLAGGGSGDLDVARLQPDGSLDAAFDGPSGTGNGKVSVDVSGADQAQALAIDGFGRVVLVGSSAGATDFAVVRLNGADGTLDTTFDTDGKQTVDFFGGTAQEIAYAAVIRPDGRVVVAGHANGDVAVAVLGGGGTRSYLVQDANFDVTAVADATGQVVDRYRYDTYGTMAAYNADFSADYDNAGEANAGFAFQGLRFDANSGNYHARYRDLDPGLGRWTQQDLLRYSDSTNLYLGYLANPKSKSDPLGLASGSVQGSVYSLYITIGFDDSIKDDRMKNLLDKLIHDNLEILYKMIKVCEEKHKTFKNVFPTVTIDASNNRYGHPVAGDVYTAGDEAESNNLDNSFSNLSATGHPAFGAHGSIPIIVTSRLMQKKGGAYPDVAGFATGVGSVMRPSWSSTLSHELGHLLGYDQGDLDNHIHNSGGNNIMNRTPADKGFLEPDECWCMKLWKKVQQQQNLPYLPQKKR